MCPALSSWCRFAGGGTSVNFGNKAVRSQTGIDVVIKNADTAQTITTPTFTLSDMVNFSVDTNAGGASDCFDEIADGGGLEGGEQCTIRVFFRPQSLPDASIVAPNMSSTLIVGGANTNLTLMVQGNAVSALTITPATKDYMGVAVNGSATQVFMITNSSDVGIPTTGLVAVSLDGPNTGDFRISANTCAVAAGLTPGGHVHGDGGFRTQEPRRQVRHLGHHRFADQRRLRDADRYRQLAPPDPPRS